MDNSLIADNCIRILNQSGIALSITKFIEVRNQIIEALESKQFHLYKKNGQPAGFFTWQIQDKEVLLQNLFILPQFRGKDNFFSLRKFFRSKYPDAKLFYYKNHRRNKTFIVREDKELCII